MKFPSKNSVFQRSFLSAVGSGVEPHTREGTGQVSVATPAMGDYLPQTYRNNIIAEIKKITTTLKGMLFPIPYRYGVRQLTLDIYIIADYKIMSRGGMWISLIAYQQGMGMRF